MNNSAEVSIAIKLGVDAAPLIAAVESLELALKALPEVTQRFLDSLDSLVELCRADQDELSAGGTSDLWIVLKPSDRLRDFLATAGAGDLEFHAAEI